MQTGNPKISKGTPKPSFRGIIGIEAGTLGRHEDECLNKEIEDFLGISASALTVRSLWALLSTSTLSLKKKKKEDSRSVSSKPEEEWNRQITSGNSYRG